jgi:hypothetical protein
MRMKLAFAATAILAGAFAASTSAETLNCVASGLSGVTTSLISAVHVFESSTWEMLLVGFLGLVYAARPRRKKSRLEGLTACPEGSRDGSFDEPALVQNDVALGLVGSLEDFDLDTRQIPFPPRAEVRPLENGGWPSGAALPSRQSRRPAIPTTATPTPPKNGPASW